MIFPTFDKIPTFCYTMQDMSFTTQVTDKGYILIPSAARKKLNLKPKQTVHLHVVGRKVELEPLMTLEEVFNFVKPTSRKITQKELKEETRMAQEAIAENAASEGL